MCIQHRHEQQSENARAIKSGRGSFTLHCIGTAPFAVSKVQSVVVSSLHIHILVCGISG